MSQRPAARLLFLFFLALLSALPPAHAEEGRVMLDAAGRSVSVSDTSRIVSVGGAVTEILYALGVEDRIVAVDTTSTFPARAHEKASVGYMRALSAEGVLSVNPTLVLAVEGSGPRDTIEVLEKASVPFLIVPEAKDVETMTRKIRFVAEAVGAARRGEELAEAVAADLRAFEADRARIVHRRKAIFLLSTSSGAPMVAGQGTLADSIFNLAGVDNALTGFSGYKPANDEAALASGADAIVVMAERAGELTPERIFAAPAFADTPAAQTKRLIALPAAYLLGFGPRIAHAARDLAASVYPELSFPELPDRPWVGREQAAAAP